MLVSSSPFFITMNLKFNMAIGFLFIIAGLLIGSDSIASEIKTANIEPVINLVSKESDNVSEPSLKNEIQEEKYYPIHVEVPSVLVSVAVETADYDYANNNWPVSDSLAHFMSITQTPNRLSGNTYIYGHNRAGIFANLNNAKIGDMAEVKTSGGKTFLYSLSSIHDVSPADLSMLDYNGKPILTLQTCSGIFDQNRRLFIFNFEGSK